MDLIDGEGNSGLTLAPAESANVRMTVVNTTTTSVGTSRYGMMAIQPPWNRSPSPTPTAVISAVDSTVRPASAISLPTNTLARCTGKDHQRLSRPLLRSRGTLKPAPSAPNIPPAKEHTGTRPLRLSVPLIALIDSPTSR